MIALWMPEPPDLAHRIGVGTGHYEHLSASEVARYAANQLNFELRRAVERHIITCADCLRQLQSAKRRQLSSAAPGTAGS
jgi:hypothetical protein